MIDLHCHLLPAVDDGARSVEQAVRVLEQMAAAGVTAVCLTPHFDATRAGQGLPPRHDQAFAALSAAAPTAVALHRGVELMLDRPFPEPAVGNPALRLAGSRYMLVEFPPAIAAPAARSALARLAGLGIVPVLAHPERYGCCSPEVVGSWKSAGALMQVDSTTAFRPGTRGQRARALLAAGLADLLAADNHGDDRILPTALQALRDHGVIEQADLLVRANPEAIVTDRVPQPVAPIVFEQSLLERVRQLFRTGE